MTIETGALFAGMAAVLLLYGLRSFLARNVALEQFIPGQGGIAEPLSRRSREKAAIPPVRAALLALTGGTAAGGVTLTVTGSMLLSLAVSLLGLAAPTLWLRWQSAGRRKQLTSQVEQAVEAMSAVLRSGGGVPAALEAAVKDAGEPLQPELAQVIAEIRLGYPTAAAFQRLAERIRLPEMDMVSMAIELQQSGLAVNLAAVLGQVQDNIREAQGFGEEVSAITAENRMAGWVVAVMPFVAIGLIRQVAPGFVAPLFSTTVGMAVLVAGTLAIIVGVGWIMRMVNMEEG